MLRKQGMKRSMVRFDIVGQLGSLRRYARSLTRDSADAEDLVHDALARAYERRSTFRSGGNLRAWLLAIVHNIFIDGVRARRSEAARIKQAGQLADISTPAPQDHSVRLSQVREAFLSLPEEQRSALHLVAIEGLSYAQAAEVSGVPLGTLMSRIGRARAALREMEEGASAKARSHLRIVGDES
ncbi:MAG: sigma-70 family RNA polymerase sigma factor [Mesorhizobium sp.]|uniref:sigma-70 family RNA polymerase sigma factor n=2 Tax=Mesorhizobium sp. TaxID=1871066 RepID=UPI000FE4D884|nr:sigma-70 family RNA polymerase sigma factor [Mesorhizobium sp.]RWM27760.1 MAG: sigma-70 family RNA polymerase sigma factor [Mesorhizobium sp.]RWM39888.1 MAG: sigma-70 family RNA polymerase sigma factor [Mesorhizobium sp.]TJV53445.1 MAG: sigma-70 family RNA polymerase sigma factor [Mesorhizobium sp.]